MDGEFGRLWPAWLAPFPGLALFVCCVARLRRRIENAGTNLRTRFEAFQPGNLIAQLLIDSFDFGDAIRKLPQDPQQRLDQRRTLFRPNLGKLHLHASQTTKSIRNQLRQFSELLRSYRGWMHLQSMLDGAAVLMGWEM